MLLLIELLNVLTLQGFTEQYEINIVSDFDGMHNFTFGAYDFQSEADNRYTIQTTAYLLMNDFDQHPYSALFGGTLDNHAGQTFYAVLAGAFQTQRSRNCNSSGSRDYCISNSSNWYIGSSY